MSQQARTVTATAKQGGILDVKSLVLLAILLAAGFILNMTLGNALGIVGIKPQFIIAAYALAILLTDAGLVQAAVFGVISACVIQLTTSIPGLNFATELAGALVMAALIKANINVGGKNITPLVAAFLTTLVSGALFAVCGTLIMGAALPTVVDATPLALLDPLGVAGGEADAFTGAAVLGISGVALLVLGTAVFNAIVVQALFFPLEKVLNK